MTPARRTVRSDKKELLATERFAEGALPSVPDAFQLVELAGDVVVAPNIPPNDLEKAFGDLFNNFESTDQLPPIDVFARGILELQRERTWQLFLTSLRRISSGASFKSPR
jgi:hypothetical protein